MLWFPVPVQASIKSWRLLPSDVAIAPIAVSHLRRREDDLKLISCCVIIRCRDTRHWGGSALTAIFKPESHERWGWQPGRVHVTFSALALLQSCRVSAKQPFPIWAPARRTGGTPASITRLSVRLINLFGFESTKPQPQDSEGTTAFYHY